MDNYELFKRPSLNRSLINVTAIVVFQNKRNCYKGDVFQAYGEGKP